MKKKKKKTKVRTIEISFKNYIIKNYIIKNYIIKISLLGISVRYRYCIISIYHLYVIYLEGSDVYSDEKSEKR